MIVCFVVCVGACGFLLRACVHFLVRVCVFLCVRVCVCALFVCAVFFARVCTFLCACVQLRFTVFVVCMRDVVVCLMS